MNQNIQLNSAVSYKPCIKCNKGLSKSGDIYCKNCKPKREYNRTLSKSLSKVYLGKFEADITPHDKEVTQGCNLLGIKTIFSLKYSNII
jgi:hypothetical protein